MTVEEALVALLAGVAGILLFIGLAQALDGRPAREHRPTQCMRHDRRTSRPDEESSVKQSMVRDVCGRSADAPTEPSAPQGS
jgi:hypothetical protein